jgi:hypothetical protein
MTTSPDLDKKIPVIPTHGSPSADLGVADTCEFAWIELISQVILAAIGITIAAYAGQSARLLPGALAVGGPLPPPPSMVGESRDGVLVAAAFRFGLAYQSVCRATSVS